MRRRFEITFKITFLASLVLLTFTVLAYNSYFHRIPSEMYVQAWRWATGSTPDNYTDVTNDMNFRLHVFPYANASVELGESIQISEISTGRYWFQEVYDSPWHNIDIKYGDDFYLVSVWYQQAYYPSLLEYIALWSINISTLALWGLFVAFILAPRIETQKEEVKTRCRRNT